jgi:hypothetical protein
MIVETDMEDYVGSSYGWATTRDWPSLACFICTKEVEWRTIV